MPTSWSFSQIRTGISSRKYPKECVSKLVQLGLLLPGANYLCNICAYYYYEDKDNQRKKQKVDNTIGHVHQDPVSVVIDILDRGSIPQSDINRLSLAMGRN